LLPTIRIKLNIKKVDEKYSFDRSGYNLITILSKSKLIFYDLKEKGIKEEKSITR
jgi:hypothetical protein